MTKKRRNRPDVDSLLPDVDDEIQGNSSDDSSPPKDEEEQRHNDKTTKRQDDKQTSRDDDMTALAQQLDVLMEGPDTPYENKFPELGARANGYLNDEVERALQQATSVLKNQFDGVSKSLLMNYAIRVALWDLRENADESQLVKWLQEVEKAE